MIKELFKKTHLYAIALCMVFFGLFVIYWIVYIKNLKDAGDCCILTAVFLVILWKTNKTGYLSYDDKQVYIRQLTRLYTVPYTDIRKLDLRIGDEYNFGRTEYGRSIYFESEPGKIKSRIFLVPFGWASELQNFKNYVVFKNPSVEVAD